MRSKWKLLSRRRKITIAATFTVVVLAALLINGPGFTVLFHLWRYGPAVSALPEADGFEKHDHVLVVSPHPDDETLCCAGQIQQAREAGAEVFIVWLTSGDGFKVAAALSERTIRPTRSGSLTRLGERRMGEARAAAAALGVDGSHLFFLGYPDRGLQGITAGPPNQRWLSKYTRFSRVHYSDAFSPGAAYTGSNLSADLHAIFALVKPDVVLAPSPLDAHADHRITGELVMGILEGLNEPEIARWWIVHGGVEWPLPKGLRLDLPLFLPPRGRSLDWQRVDLTREQQMVKLQALRAHKSQLSLSSRFLHAFVRRNELVSTGPLPGR